jgi:hypothetical protein
MMITFSAFKRDIFNLVFPEGMAEQRVPLFRNLVVNSLIQLQTYVESYQLLNVNFYDKDQSADDCGLSVIQGCRGRIGAIYAFEPSCRCRRYFYESASLEKLSCLYEQCRCAQTGCVPSSVFSLSAYTRDPAYCGYNIGGNEGCAPPYLPALPEDACEFISSEKYFAVGPANKIWLFPRFPCNWVVGVHSRGIRRSYLDNDYVLDDDDLKDAVACYVESEVARRVDKDQASADKLYADYRMKAGDIIFREEQDLKPRATRICIEGLDLSELVQIYPDNPYPVGVGESCAVSSGVAQIESFLNTAQTFVAECAEDLTGSPVEVTIAAGAYSAATQEEADALALAAATEQAQAALECSDPCVEPYPDTIHSVDGAAAFNALTDESPIDGVMVQGVNFWDSIASPVIPGHFAAMRLGRGGGVGPAGGVIIMFVWQSGVQIQIRYAKSDGNPTCPHGEYEFNGFEDPPATLVGTPQSPIHVTYS